MVCSGSGPRVHYISELESSSCGQVVSKCYTYCQQMNMLPKHTPPNTNTNIYQQSLPLLTNFLLINKMSNSELYKIYHIFNNTTILLCIINTLNLPK